MGDVSYPWKPNYELIWIIGKGFAGPRSSSILRYPISPAGGRVHPTQKHIGLMRDLVAKCPPGVIVDPFMGSGTTLRACADLHRPAIGIELEERYCRLAVTRLGQGALDFGGAA